MLILLVVFGVAACFFAGRVPSSFLPDEDQGYVFVNLQLPNGASLERTTAAAAEVEKILQNTPGVQVHNQRRRLQPAELRAHQLQRFLFRHPQAVG